MRSVKRMFVVWTALLFAFVVLSSGCSSESSSSNNNVQEADATIGEDAQINADGGNTDVSSETEDVSDEQKDVAADVEQDDDVAVNDGDTSAADVEPDVEADVEADVETDTSEGEDVVEQADVALPGEDPFEDRPMGQCNVSAECEIMAAGFRSCTRDAPGGLCGGCGEGDCGSMQECVFGTCQNVCTSREDCAPGLTCSSRGVCSLERCVDDKCPTPMFGCSESGYCKRVACAQQSDCPELTTCSDGLCIEDRQL